MYHFLIICAILFFAKEAKFLSVSDRAALYENCEIFNVTYVYGGPVCGDDSKTYANSLFLDCLNHHNSKTVATMHSGPCHSYEQQCTINLYYEPVCGSDDITYTNQESLLCVMRKYSKQINIVSKGPCASNDYCYRGGAAVYGMNPVCANNGFTYQNPAQVKCLQQYNKELLVQHDGGCTVDHVTSLYGRTEALCTLAKTRYEWNPVCGSDGFTYPNPFVFLCFHSQLKVTSNGECDISIHDSCIEAYANTTIPENEESINHSFHPDEAVCGSDGITYHSIHHLHCHTRRNKYLFVRHEGPCFGPDDNPCGAIPEEDHRLPVCGSDGKSYVSPEALWCAKLRSPELKLTYMHDGPC